VINGLVGPIQHEPGDFAQPRGFALTILPKPTNLVSR
jgi:hypothetical protein